jgi:cystathionine beta-synthase
VVGSAGTGGTLTGTGRYLKERNPAIRILAADPVGSIYAHYHATHEKTQGAPYKIEGIGGDKIPGALDFDVIDEFHTFNDREAFHMARRLTREEGLFVGGSAGINVALSVRMARQLDDPDALIVCFLPDTGERYLSKIYNEEWLRENQLLEPERMTAGDMLARKDGGAPPLVLVRPGATTREALQLITQHDISQIPVCDEGECVGSLSESNLMSHVIEDPTILDRAVDELMDAALPVVDTSASMSGIGRLLTRQTPAVLVRKDGDFVGIITRYDVVRQLTHVQR